MPGIVFDEIEAYIDRLASRGDAALQAVEEQGPKEDWPILGPPEGSLLHIPAKSVRPHGISTPRRAALGLTDTALGSGGAETPGGTRGPEVTPESNQRLPANPRFIVVIPPWRAGVPTPNKVGPCRRPSTAVETTVD